MSRPRTDVDQSPGFDIVLRVLDHQIVGPEGELAGNIDDLALTDDGSGVLRVTGLLLGAAALGTRLPAWLGQRSIAIWRRLSRRDTDEPDHLALSEVESIGSAVQVNADAARRVARSDRLEGWLRDHLVDRIPGAGKDPEGAEQEEGHAEPTGGVQLSPAPPGTHRLSQLLGATAVRRDGRVLGSVVRVFTDFPGREDTQDGPVTFTADDETRRSGLRVTSLLVGRRSMWLLMEHDLPDGRSGPPLLGRLLRAMSPTDRPVPWEQVVEVDWDRRRVVLEDRPGHDRRQRG